MTDYSSIDTIEKLMSAVEALRVKLVSRERTSQEYMGQMQQVIWELSTDLETYSEMYSIASNVRAYAGLRLDRLVNRYMQDDFSGIADVFKAERAAKRKAKSSPEQLFLLQARAIEKEVLNQLKACKQKLIAAESNKKGLGH